MTANDPESDRPAATRAEKLRAQIEEITAGGQKKKTGTVPTGAPEVRPTQPKSLNEILEERMRDHVGEKKRRRPS
jgi:hypothetical protein